MWNEIRNKLIAMARDFPEDQYDFKLPKDQRSFAENLLPVAAVDYDLMRSVSGQTSGPISARTNITRRKTSTRRKPTW
jgi:hypothetical protein